MTDTSRTEIIRRLNEILTGELTAINQYFLHSRMLKDWGILKLAAYEYEESIDEMKHADQLIERILYLDGLPNVQRLGKVNIGENVREIFTADLGIEDEAIPRLNEAIDFCREAGDNGTRVLLDGILTSEEEHRDWLVTQLELMDRVGDKAYIAENMHA